MKQGFGYWGPPGTGQGGQNDSHQWGIPLWAPDSPLIPTVAQGLFMTFTSEDDTSNNCLKSPENLPFPHVSLATPPRAICSGPSRQGWETTPRGSRPFCFSRNSPSQRSNEEKEAPWGRSKGRGLPDSPPLAYPLVGVSPKNPLCQEQTGAGVSPLLPSLPHLPPEQKVGTF